MKVRQHYLQLPITMPIVEHRVADVVCAIFGVRSVFGSHAPDAMELLQKEAIAQFHQKYGRLPEPTEMSALSDRDMEHTIAATPIYRKRGCVWRAVNGARIGISEEIMAKFSDDGMLLDHGAETALYLALHRFEEEFRKSKSLTFEIDESTALQYYDPAGACPTSSAKIRHAFEILSHLVIIFDETSPKSREFSPILKNLEINEGRYRITINECFISNIMRVLNHGGKRTGRRHELKNVHYFHDHPTRTILANCPPEYTTTQRRIQMDLLRLPSAPRRNDPPGYKVIHQGTVGDWLERIGYRRNRRRQLRQFATDLQVVVGDAGGYCEPDPRGWESIASARIEEESLRILVPATFLADRYPKLIEERSGLKLLPLSNLSEAIRAVLENGISGADIKEWRIAFGISQAGLAKAAGISERQLRRFENSIQALDPSMQCRLYAALGTCCTGRKPDIQKGNSAQEGHLTGEFGPERTRFQGVQPNIKIQHTDNQSLMEEKNLFNIL